MTGPPLPGPRRDDAATAASRQRARVLAAERREALRRRIRRIRYTVAGAAATLFIAAFLVVYVQLASGHDPAPARRASSKAASTSGGSSSTTSGETSGSSSETSGSSGETSESRSEGASSMTTSQS
jgi:hypothetical protein